MAILLTTVAAGYGGNSTWELQRPEGVDTGITVTYNNGTGEVTVPDGTLTAGTYWLKHTLVGSAEGTVTKQFTAYDINVSASVISPEVGCGTVSVSVSGGSGNYEYTYRKDDPVEGTIVYGPTTDNVFDPNTEADPPPTPGTSTTYYVSVTDNTYGCGGSDSVTLTACGTTSDRVNNFAHGLLTLDANISNGEAVTIGPKTYTFQDTLTDVDGNVHIGASIDETIDNFVSAVNLLSGAGTKYATSMTVHPSVKALDMSATDQVGIYAKSKGAAGETIGTTETLSQGSFDNATLQILYIDCNGGSPRIRTYVSARCAGGNMDINVNLQETGEGAEYNFDYTVNYPCGPYLKWYNINSINNGTYDVTVTSTNDLEQTFQVTKQITVSC
jgi:hypothetical protein